MGANDENEVKKAKQSPPGEPTRILLMEAKAKPPSEPHRVVEHKKKKEK